MTWQHFFNRGQTPWNETLLIFAAVWLGYAADRWFDAYRYNTIVLPRHQFYRDHRSPLLIIWTLVLILSLGLAFRTLSQAQLLAGFSFMALSIVFTILIQKRLLGTLHAIAKPLITAVLVAGSSHLFSVPLAPTAPLPHWIPLILLTLLFLINCLYIQAWDQKADKQQDPLEQRANPLPPYSLSAAHTLLILFGILSLTVNSALAIPQFVATLISLTLLALLHKFKNRIQLQTRRTYADLTLLTPLLILALTP